MVRTLVSAGELSLSCARLLAGWVTTLWLTGRLHGTIVGPTGWSDWSVRLVGPTIVSCKRFVRLVGIKHV